MPNRRKKKAQHVEEMVAARRVGIAKRPYGAGIEGRTVSADSGVVNRLTTIANALNVTVSSLATAAFSNFIELIGDDPSVLKRIELKARWDQKFRELSQVEEEMKQLAPEGKAAITNIRVENPRPRA